MTAADPVRPACTGAPDLCGAAAGQPCEPGCPSLATDPEPTPVPVSSPSLARRAAGDVRALIRRVAETVHGATITHRPVPGCQVLTDTVLDDPLAGVRAADLVQRVAMVQVREHADAARAAGRTWSDIAEALGIADSQCPRGELAYLLLVEHQALPVDPPSFQRSSTWWRCTTCAERVTDYGPFDPHPSDREDGHTPDCNRHAADLTAYRAGWEA